MKDCGRRHQNPKKACDAYLEKTLEMQSNEYVDVEELKNQSVLTDY